MNKKTFIKNLKAKLSILEENEINDIVSEYTNIIDEKIENGKSEKEAIQDFGNFDELVAEILKAYKINPNFGKKEEKVDYGTAFENWVKEASSKMANFFKGIVSDIKSKDNDFSIETVFEIMIKAILLLIILSVLRLPFILIENLGESILEVLPIFWALSWLWVLFVWVLYIIVCILIAIAMFKEYRITSNKKEETPITLKKDSYEKTKKKEPIVEPVIKEKKESKLGKILYGILKVFVFLVILLPLWMIILAFTLSLIVALYYSIIGVNLWGLVLIFLGFLLITCNINHIVNNLLNHRKNHYFGLTLIPFIVVCVGVVMLFHSSRYYEYDSSNLFELTTEKHEYTVNQKTHLRLDGRYNRKIDNGLEDDKIIVEVNYYDEVIDVVEYYTEPNFIDFYVRKNIDERVFWKIYDEGIDGLKDYKIIDYEPIFETQYTVYGNEKTLNNLKINNMY